MSCLLSLLLSYCPLLYYTVLYTTILSSTLLYCLLLYSTVLYVVILCNFVSCYIPLLGKPFLITSHHYSPLSSTPSLHPPTPISSQTPNNSTPPKTYLHPYSPPQITSQTPPKHPQYSLCSPIAKEGGDY